MNRGHFPSDEAEVKLPKAGDLRHPWTCYVFGHG